MANCFPKRPMPLAPVAPPALVGRRISARLRLFLPATLVTLHGHQNCWIENLSRSGARLANAAPPPVGSYGVVKVQDIENFGKVVWRSANRFGLAFDQLLTQQQLVALRHFSEAYPEIARKRDQEEVRQWVGVDTAKTN